MIPKVIHYIWLGNNPEPKILQKCKKSWKKYCLDYEIKRWDETNLDLEKYQFAKDAYNAKKWAFASDVFRFDILNENGGIYLDTDVEILKPIDEFLEYSLFTGFEDSKTTNPGLIMGCEKNHKICQDMINIYKKAKFDIEKLNDITICKFMTEYLVKEFGLQTNGTTQKFDGVAIFAPDYFCPKQLNDDNEYIYSNNTHSVHHYAGSWTAKPPLKKRIANFFKKTIRILIGSRLYIKLKKKIKGKKNGKK